MPTIFIRLPKEAFPGEARTELVLRINEAAASAERIPDNPRQRALCWVVIDEIDGGAWTSGGADMRAHILPCMVMIYLPAGVLDDAARALYVKAMHAAFESMLVTDEPRQLVTSVVLHEVADGNWGINGAIWTLPHFAKAAGFEHLRHLVE